VSKRVVTHRETQAAGLVEATCAKLHRWDNEGPWAKVQFDDGLLCWVPERDLEDVPMLDDLLARRWNDD